VADPDGTADLVGMMILIGPSLGGAKSCLLFYDATAGFVALADDTGTQFPSAAQVGSANMIENSQCSIASGGASVSISGTILSLTLPITFKSTFTGNQTIFLFTQDRAGAYAGWDARGTWDVPPGDRPPSTISITPSAASGVSQTFTFSVADPDGTADLVGMMILIGPSLGGAKSCLLFYDPSAGIVALANDSGTQFPWGGGLGSNVTIQNSYCSVGLLCPRHPPQPNLTPNL
jgi:hypothetical protein